MAKAGLGIAVIWMLAAPGGCRREASMSFEKLEFSVAELSTAPQLLTVRADGQARYETHSNAAWIELPEIGAYERVLTPEELRALNQALMAPPVAELPDHWGRVPSGDRCHRIKVTSGDQTVEKLVGSREPVDPRTQNLIRLLEQLAARVAQSPVQVLRMTLSDAAADAQGRLAATLTFASVGPQAVVFQNLLGPPLPPPPKVLLEAWPDKPPGQLSAHDVIRGPVSGLKVLSLPPTAASNQPGLLVPASQSASFHLDATPGFRMAGPHVVRVRFLSEVREAGGAPLIYGEIYSNLVKVVVPAAAR
jgi:hypothetical protein